MIRRPNALAKTRRRVAGNVGWTLVGNAVTAGSKAAVLIGVARLGDPTDVGSLVLAMAIAAPIQTFSNLRLRSLLATEPALTVADRYPLYATANVLTSVAALLLMSGIAVLLPGRSTGAALAAVGVLRLVESLAEVRYGYLQRLGRYDGIAVSLVLRSIGGVTAFLIAFEATHDLWLSVLLQAGVNLVVALAWDRRTLPAVSRRSPLHPASVRRQLPASWTLAKSALPLGVAALLVSFNSNVAQYVLEVTGSARDVGVYGATAYLTTSVALVHNALAQSVLPEFAAAVESGDLDRLVRSVRKLSRAIFVICLVGAVLSVLFGDVLLRVIYGPAYAGGDVTLALLLFAAGFSGMAGFADYAAMSMRALRPHAPIMLAVVGTTVAAVSLGRWLGGRTGAAGGVLAGATVQYLLMARLVRVTAREQSSIARPA